MPIENIPSVLELGILSNEGAKQVKHRSIALVEAQDKRDVKHVPGGLRLHQYANLYFHARNPMMYKRQGESSTICVLRVSTAVLEIDGVVLADRNAASGDQWVRFLAPKQWRELNFDRIFARDWRDENRFTYYDKKRQKCAEVLVPNCVPPAYFIGAYAVDGLAAQRLKTVGFSLPIQINADMFFQ